MNAQLEKLLDRCNEMDITEQLNWLGDANMSYQAKMEYVQMRLDNASLRARVGEAEMIVAWQAGDISEGRAAKMLNIDRLKLRTLRDEIRAAALAKGAK